jgi:hypothetical protein
MWLAARKNPVFSKFPAKNEASVGSDLQPPEASDWTFVACYQFPGGSHKTGSFVKI